MLNDKCKFIESFNNKYEDNQEKNDSSKDITQDKNYDDEPAFDYDPLNNIKDLKIEFNCLQKSNDQTVEDFAIEQRLHKTLKNILGLDEVIYDETQYDDMVQANIDRCYGLAQDMIFNLNKQLLDDFLSVYEGRDYVEITTLYEQNLKDICEYCINLCLQELKLCQVDDADAKDPKDIVNIILKSIRYGYEDTPFVFIKYLNIDEASSVCDDGWFHVSIYVLIKYDALKLATYGRQCQDIYEDPYCKDNYEDEISSKFLMHELYPQIKSYVDIQLKNMIGKISNNDDGYDMIINNILNTCTYFNDKYKDIPRYYVNDLIFKAYKWSNVDLIREIIVGPFLFLKNVNDLGIVLNPDILKGDDVDEKK
jgi:hypothetical protein